VPTQPSPPEEPHARADALIVTALREERDAAKAVATGALGEWTGRASAGRETVGTPRALRETGGFPRPSGGNTWLCSGGLSPPIRG